MWVVIGKTFILNSSESILYYSEKRLFPLLVVISLLHLYILLTVDFEPLYQVIKEISDTQRAVSISLEHDADVAKAHFIGLVDHQGADITDTSVETQIVENQLIQEAAEDLTFVAVQTDQASNTAFQMAQQRPIMAQLNHPKRRVISAATHQHEDAAYLFRWQQYIESIGNERYPKEALQKKITGHLRLLISIDKAGSVQDIVIRQSSGHHLLDQAALDIVKHAQPFEPIPESMMQDNEFLEIIRTWDFRGRSGLALPG